MNLTHHEKISIIEIISNSIAIIEAFVTLVLAYAKSAMNEIPKRCEKLYCLF